VCVCETIYDCLSQFCAPLHFVWTPHTHRLTLWRSGEWPFCTNSFLSRAAFLKDLRNDACPFWAPWSIIATRRDLRIWTCMVRTGWKNLGENLGCRNGLCLWSAAGVCAPTCTLRKSYLHFSHIMIIMLAGPNRQKHVNIALGNLSHGWRMPRLNLLRFIRLLRLVQFVERQSERVWACVYDNHMSCA
jgi:hypothetical protein